MDRPRFYIGALMSKPIRIPELGTTEEPRNISWSWLLFLSRHVESRSKFAAIRLEKIKYEFSSCIGTESIGFVASLQHTFVLSDVRRRSHVHIHLHSPWVQFWKTFEPRTPHACSMSQCTKPSTDYNHPRRGNQSRFVQYQVAATNVNRCGYYSCVLNKITHICYATEYNQKRHMNNISICKPSETSSSCFPDERKRKLYSFWYSTY